MEAEQFDLAFAERDESKNSSWCGIHGGCAGMQVKQVDAEVFRPEGQLTPSPIVR
jgi:hypothetical protein